MFNSVEFATPAVAWIWLAYCPTPVCTNIGNHAEKMANEARTWPPVADHDNAITEFDTPLTLAPLANDIAYGTRIDPRTLDQSDVLPGFVRDHVPASYFRALSVTIP